MSHIGIAPILRRSARTMHTCAMTRMKLWDLVQHRLETALRVIDYSPPSNNFIWFGYTRLITGGESILALFLKRKRTANDLFKYIVMLQQSDGAR